MSMRLFFHYRNEDLRILASDEFGVIPASTRLQVALATVASSEKKVLTSLHAYILLENLAYAK